MVAIVEPNFINTKIAEPGNGTEKINRRQKMKRKILITIIVIFCSNQTFGLDLMGPTSSELTGVGQFHASINYIWNELDIDADGIPEIGLSSTTIKNVEIEKFYANFGMGMGKDSELFFIVGAAKAKPDKHDNDDNIAGYIGASDENLLLGIGAKINFYKTANCKWGVLTQMSWTDFDFDGKSYTLDGYNLDVSADIEVFEVQVAIGPSYKLNPNVLLYGGPFLHFLNGDVELKGSIDGISGGVETDIEEDSIFGGYIGTSIELAKNTNINFEFQLTGAGQGVGVSLRHRF